MINKTCKNHELMLVTKSCLVFVEGTRVMLTSKYVITAALYEMASMFYLFFCLPESVALHWMKVIIYLNDVGICKAWKSLIFTNHPCVFLVRAVTVPPATGHTFLNAIFRSATHDIIQPDFTCRFLTSQVRLQQLFYLFSESL